MPDRHGGGPRRWTAIGAPRPVTAVALVLAVPAGAVVAAAALPVVPTGWPGVAGWAAAAAYLRRRRHPVGVLARACYLVAGLLVALPYVRFGLGALDGRPGGLAGLFVAAVGTKLVALLLAGGGYVANDWVRRRT